MHSAYRLQICLPKMNPEVYSLLFRQSDFSAFPGSTDKSFFRSLYPLTGLLQLLFLRSSDLFLSGTLSEVPPAQRTVLKDVYLHKLNRHQQDLNKNIHGSHFPNQLLNHHLRRGGIRIDKMPFTIGIYKAFIESMISSTA